VERPGADFVVPDVAGTGGQRHVCTGTAPPGPITFMAMAEPKVAGHGLPGAAVTVDQAGYETIGPICINHSYDVAGEVKPELVLRKR